MTTPTAGPDMGQIGKTQNEDPNLRRYLAARHYYRQARWLHLGGVFFTTLLALASPFVLLFSPGVGPTLGAVAGGWLFVSRILFEPIKRGLQLRGATAQEMFDCSIFELSWNDSLVRRLPEEEIRAASGSMKGVDKVRDWYPTDEEMDWPTSVIVCQRSNAVWARRQHHAYGWFLVIVATLWGIIGVAVAVLDGATLAEYLVTIGLPSLPALLDATEYARAHFTDASRRQLIEDEIDALLRSDGGTELDLREIQDQLFNLRREAQLVPELFYKALRRRFENDMRYAAGRVAREHLPRDRGTN